MHQTFKIAPNLPSQFSRQDSDEYFVNAIGFLPYPWNALYYQPRAPVPDYSSSYEGRTLNRQQSIANNAVSTPISEKENDQSSEGRLSLGSLSTFNTGIFKDRFLPGSAWRPFGGLANRISITYNPNMENSFETFDSCTSPSPSGDAGICVPGSVCSLFGGRPSGSCPLGKICCINTVNKCGGAVTLNNTLDFVSFNTAQPTAGTCTDTFQVGGATTVAPIICGDNTGQHMYLDLPSSALTPSNVQLMFSFGAVTASRSWNIKIAMLPCGASYLAPVDCLQYFTDPTGRVTSFNWQDVAVSATRQLNNQHYNICFRTELVSLKVRQRAAQMCFSVCSVSNGDAFSITTPTSTAAALAAIAVTTATANLAAAQAHLAVTQAGINPLFPTTAQYLAVIDANTAVRDSQAALSAAQTTFATATATAASNSGVGISAPVNGVNMATCLYDFLVIAGARDAANGEADRYCGNALNPAANPLTSNVQPFKISYGTDGTEGAVVTGTNILPAPADTHNTGFCLDYQEK
ncbi:hypothetical protein DAPPUDRAFT_254734 [Daphnia pulex]|uniref:CUB domain-containing protein n=1 Tax=Daphnia pulex TaxID=6669 RepID=E9H7S3_DAPPU|nr:hypothetical protein DAPPUDRAFT_254734 [Daphnia pulex]|eukprot:EFX72229.1 hypothetical protein DAPPUDRAFT_254734 [Daphnia pulex]